MYPHGWVGGQRPGHWASQPLPRVLERAAFQSCRLHHARAWACRFEAFHVFKIFVANPHKEARVRNVLLRNQPKLLEFMASFQGERADEQFVEEKEFLINEIANLQPAPSEHMATSRGASSEGDEAGR